MLGCRAAALLVTAALLAACSAPRAPDDGAVETGGPTVDVTGTTLVTEPAGATPAREARPPAARPRIADYPVPDGDHPHDVAPAPDGRVWYTAQGGGALGVLEPDTGDVERVELGQGSAPHGVIVGPDGAPWVTDSGLNAIVRVDPETLDVETFPLPRPDDANLNTATFDGDGMLWFTGQAGIYGRLDPRSGDMEVFDAPRGLGPYGIATTPDGTVWFASLAGSYIARVAPDGTAEVVDVPTAGGGARRVWSDSLGRLWVTEWNAGNLARYDPDRRRWREWTLPGASPQPYAVYVDETDTVWATDFGADAIVRFEPDGGMFTSLPNPSPGAEVRQLLGRPGEVWGAGSATDTLIVVRTD
jgi:virginiamycin B lyase